MPRSLDDLLGADSAGRLEEMRRRHPALDDVLTGKRRAVIHPAAKMGRWAAQELRAVGVRVAAFGDQDLKMHGTTVEALPVKSPADVATQHRGDVILVASTMHDSAIAEDYRDRGFADVIPVGYLNLRLPRAFPSREYGGAFESVADPANRRAIEAAYGCFADERSRRVFLGKLAFYLTLEKARVDAIKSRTRIYFDPDVYVLDDDELVVDGGAYIGDTLGSFLDASRGRFRSYVAFEPDHGNFRALSGLASTDPERITAIRAGLGRTTSTGRFLMTDGLDARLLGDDEAGGEETPVVSLNAYFESRPRPSIVKLDIEGAEREALLGATRVIEQSILAVSAYHRPEDLWEIPLLLREISPVSDISLRHYTREIDDTVCYAIPRSRLERTTGRLDHD